MVSLNRRGMRELSRKEDDCMASLCRRGYTVSYPRRKTIAIDSLSRRGCNVSYT